MSGPLTRRGFVGGGSLAAAAGIAVAAAGSDASAARETSAANPRGAIHRHALAPLRRPAPVFALVQSECRDVDPARASEDIARNLARMAEAVAAAQSDGPHKDWVAFHDAAVTGHTPLALDRDGPEFAALARLARRHDCWLSFGARVRSDGDRTAVIDAVAFLSPAGLLASLQPADGARALAPGLSLVAVTEFGNLAATPRADDPAHHAERVAAGAEFLLRTHSGPLADWALDVPVCCRAHRIHGAVVNVAAPGATPAAAPLSAGGSAFFGPDGRSLAAADGPGEQLVAFAVPMAAQRAARGRA